MSRDDAKYKYYCYKICKLTRLRKKKLKFFSDNIFNMKKTWEGINSLLNPKNKRSMVINAFKHPTSNNTINSK